ncbi:MAG TPA: dihydropteroate synthase [Acidimicrobiales bacterium]|nr:dihydropteroate synthase [Acidimicrobiales bacterium]
MKPLVMGVLNVTPDSFSDGGEYLRTEDAVARGLAMVAEGADIIDVGGESSRPGAQPVSAAEEMDRVLPVVAALAPHVRVSIDTVKPEVARAAVAAGASLVNDISASDELAWVAGSAGVGWVAMHMQGTPPTMQAEPRYTDVVAEVTAFLAERVEVGRRAGVSEVWADPGIGFGKTFAHNLTLLGSLRAMAGAVAAPLLVGTSRKSFLWTIGAGPEGRLDVRDSLEPSLATAVWAMDQGVAMVRVHDVAPTVAAARLIGPEADPVDPVGSGSGAGVAA